ncbi:MAG: hypothetical protein DWQ02_01160 [Bacteroidetes bacterium]|nr:MAG: hypothetical protein DWQ02_01160 [Bacteroidota bacterium]
MIFLRSKKPKILNTIPGFCTGIGVLFTFIVLYVEIQGNPEKFLGDNSLLQNLVIDLTAAFSTSIIGIFFSLVLSPIVKNKIDRLEKKELGNSAKLHPQILMQEMIIAFNKNNDLLQKLSEGISEKFKETLDQNTRIHQTLIDTQTESIGFHNTSTANQSNIIESVNGLIATINSEIGQIFTELANKLETATGELSTNTIAQATEDAQRVSEEFLKTAKDVLEKSGSEITAATEANQAKLQDIFDKMEILGKAINAQIQATDQKAEKSVEAINEGIDRSVDKMTGHFKGEAEKLAASFGQINQTIQSFNDTLQAATKEVIDDNLELLNESFEKIKEYNETSQTKLKEATEKFADAVNEYEKAKGENGTIAKDISAQLQENIQLRLAMESLLERWKKLTDDVVSIQNRVADIGNAISELNGIRELFQNLASNGKMRK